MSGTLPLILGLDPATRTGCAIGPPRGTPTLSTVVMRRDANDTHEDIAGRATRWINQLLDTHRLGAIAIEAPFRLTGDTNYDAAQVLTGLFWIFSGAGVARNIPVWRVVPATWRKQALGTSKFGSRNEAKNAMRLLCSQLGWPALDDNQADAAGVWIWASARYAPYGTSQISY